MSDTLVIALARDALMTALWVCLPMMVAALAVGVVVSIVQVATSIQDQTLAAAPKLVAVLAALLLSLNWIIHIMVAYTARILAAIPSMAG